MNKLIIALVILIVLAGSIVPISAILVKQGFKNQEKTWAPKVVYFGARVRMRISRLQSARMILEKAMETWPEYEKVDEAYYWVGLCYEKSHEELKALEWYRIFLQKYPNHRWQAQAQRRIDVIEAKNL